MFILDLLPFYAILRSIPNKLVGVIAMFAAILALLLLPVMDVSRSRGMQFRPLSKIAFFIFVANFLLLMQLGAKHVESPFIEFGQISTVIYFLYFTFVIYCLTMLENTLVGFSLSGIGNHYLPSLYTRNILLTGLLKSGLPGCATAGNPNSIGKDKIFHICLHEDTSDMRFVPMVYSKSEEAYIRSPTRKIKYINECSYKDEDKDNKLAEDIARTVFTNVCNCDFL